MADDAENILPFLNELHAAKAVSLDDADKVRAAMLARLLRPEARSKTWAQVRTGQSILNGYMAAGIMRRLDGIESRLRNLESRPGRPTSTV